ncbi:hypothetical protein Oweho_3251 [Owenweeksia hongkongensis DSM 17368]|uniref:Phage protein D n=1 Tax=Owenweeksia hongkongensis (strain DSM 17368 / CIP 108786 / JCM 12287 / NRRL B-23963 / UST20020801) TaxID=926562 RepID=G8R4A2_OWEHD|nr:hypothetical protein [Owenweeksia hongkongensis]AEV34202.1 hypothetical protein Oweho_3251 [Owenweeksia hongkongensis DSM 17368]
MSWGFNKLTCEVMIKGTGGVTARFLAVNKVKVFQSYKTLTDTAELTMPFDDRWKVKTQDGKQTLYILGRDGIESVFPHGSAIEIKLGYDFKNELVFSGFITGIKPQAPFVLFCEDAAWKLKQNLLNFSTRNGVTLEGVIDQLLDGTGVELHEDVKASEIVFPAGLYVNRMSTAQLLHQWKEKQGLNSFIKDGKLMIGRGFFEIDNSVFKSSLDIDYSPPTINIDEDIPRGKDRLDLQSLTAESLAIRAVSIFKTNKSLELTIVLHPDKKDEVLVIEEIDTRKTRAKQEQDAKELRQAIGGRSIFPERLQTQSRHHYNLEREELLDRAKAALFDYAQNGLTGSFTTFGDHNLQSGQSIIMVDPMNKEKEGEYLMQDVTKIFGKDGYRQEVTIPHKIND